MLQGWRNIVPARRWVGVLILTLAGLFPMTGLNCRHGRVEGPAGMGGERPPAVVTVAPAVSQEVPVYLAQIGKMLSVDMVSIVPQVGGKVVAAHVDDGAYVRKGDLLFEIDPRPFEAALSSAKATLAQAAAELEWARIEMKRVERLLAEASATEFEYDQKRVAVSIAQAKLEAAQARVDSAKLDLEYSKIYSPIDGRAGARLVDPGNVVRANDAPMLMIQSLDPIYAEFTITENELALVRQHMANRGLDPASAKEALRVEVDVPGDPADVLRTGGASAALPAGTAEGALEHAATQPAGAMAGKPDEAAISRPGAARAPREGKLTFLDNAVQDMTGTVKLRAMVPNADGYFWPGQFVNVRLILFTREHAVLVPAQAQQIGQQGPYVYVVGPESTAEIRPITPGQRQGPMIVVEKGLAAGEKVIMTGHGMVTPGGKVMVLDGAPGQGPPGMPAHATASAGH